jgi:serine kinase of HPr protein (carbohydrate metabolism regulator)
MTGLSSDRIHASCVAIRGRAVLIAGRSGSGKSDLALRLIDRGAVLVSDDYTQLDRDGETLVASPPATIAGKIEIYGVGIVAMPFAKSASVGLMVVVDEDPVRLPTPPEVRKIAGVEIPVIALAALEPSAPIKVEWAMRALDPK